MRTTRIGLAIIVFVACSSGSALAEEAQPKKTKKKAVAEILSSKRDRAAAAFQVAALVNAIKLYETQYSVLPSGGRKDGIILTDGDLIDILTGFDADNNPKRVPFIEGRAAKKAVGDKPRHSGFIDERDGSRRLVDPWGNEYAVILDWDHDGVIKIPGVKKPVRGSAVCWSFGEPKDPKKPGSAERNSPDKWISSWAEKPKKPKKGGLLGALLGDGHKKRVIADLQVFKTALNIYRINATTFPSTEQGLKALVEKPTVGRIPKSWEQTLKNQLLDPWGNPYGYRYPGTHNKGGTRYLVVRAGHARRHRG